MREGEGSVAAGAGPDGAAVGMPAVEVRASGPGAIGGEVAVRVRRSERERTEQQPGGVDHAAMLQVRRRVLRYHGGKFDLQAQMLSQLNRDGGCA